VGDARICMAALRPHNVDYAVTSPPYWRLSEWDAPVPWRDGSRVTLGRERNRDQYGAHVTEIFGGIARLLKPTGRARLVVGGSAGAPVAVTAALRKDGWHVVEFADCKIGGNESVRQPRGTELTFLLSRSVPASGRTRGRALVGTYERIPGAKFGVLGVGLLRRCIRRECPAGGVVLDPMAGIGSTGVAALREGRSFVGVELDPHSAMLAAFRLWREGMNGKG